MDYIVRNLPLIAELFGQHLRLTGIALGIALIIALPLGVLLARVRWLRGPVLGLLSVIYTVPSLSLLVLLIPFMGLGVGPAIVALVTYAQLVLVRNTVVGLTSVDPAIVEAARGMGMNSWQRLSRVELPLALPLILAGIRLATLSMIAIGTIAFLVGAGGLGKLLFEGVTTSNPQKIFAGSAAVVVLSLLANGLLWLLERRVGRMIKGEAQTSGVQRSPE
jgi:osmoprotectant transport system permease protein